MYAWHVEGARITGLRRSIPGRAWPALSPRWPPLRGRSPAMAGPVMSRTMRQARSWWWRSSARGWSCSWLSPMGGCSASRCPECYREHGIGGPAGIAQKGAQE